MFLILLNDNAAISETNQYEVHGSLRPGVSLMKSNLLNEPRPTLQPSSPLVNLAFDREPSSRLITLVLDREPLFRRMTLVLRDKVTSPRSRLMDASSVTRTRRRALDRVIKYSNVSSDIWIHGVFFFTINI